MLSVRVFFLYFSMAVIKDCYPRLLNLWLSAKKFVCVCVCLFLCVFLFACFFVSVCVCDLCLCVCVCVLFVSVYVCVCFCGYVFFCWALELCTFVFLDSISIGFKLCKTIKFFFVMFGC